jgi:hypothetical protein
MNLKISIKLPIENEIIAIKYFLFLDKDIIDSVNETFYYPDD